MQSEKKKNGKKQSGKRLNKDRRETLRYGKTKMRKNMKMKMTVGNRREKV